MRIRSSAHGAINLVDEFLSARRIQEGNFILRPDRHLVAPLCEDVLDNFLPIAKSKGVTVQQSPIPAGLEIVVDRLGFIRAVGNILSNAIKFTPKGGLVSLSVEPRADEILVRVSDSGTGMEPSEVQKIFGRFERLDRHQNVQGTGLGLFVVKNVVQAHGGKVVVTSTLGRGSTFELSFPNSPPVDERGQVIALDFA
jgi:signal transduction histidine kinase